jgi:methionine synthase II (cobalamin-independent)
MTFLKLAMQLPTGGIHMMELDEPAAREALAEMETWGDDCSQDSKEMRDALRAKFNEENVKILHAGCEA